MDETQDSTWEKKDVAAALNARFCQFEIDGGSSKLGRHDAEPHTKAAHIELFSYGIIASISSLTYGTWGDDDAALLVLVLNFRSPDSGSLRFTKAEISIDFKKQQPGNGSPVVQLFHPENNRNSMSNRPGFQSNESSGLWPSADYLIKGFTWSKKSQQEPHRVSWDISIRRDSSSDINNHSIPLCAVVSFRGPFMATVRLKATTASKLKLQSFPWSKDDPILFDGITSKGKTLSKTNLLKLEKAEIEDHLPRKYAKKSRTGGDSLASLAGTVCRIHGIPVSYSVGEFITTLSTILSVPDSSIEIKTFSRNPYQEEITALASFTSAPANLKRTQSGRWQISVPLNSAAPKDGPVTTALSPSFPNTALDLHFDTNFLGFTNLSPISTDPPNIDIVAVHGLGGHAYGSFKQRGGQYMWLNESLYSDLYNSSRMSGFSQGVKPRILLYGHDSHIDQSQTFQSLKDIAIELKVLLRGIRRDDPTRPLIFIGQSLGGLLIKELFIQWARSGSNEIDTLSLEATIGLLLFGVPNRGMDITALLSIAGEQPNAEFISSLGIGSQTLEEQSKLFPELCKSTRMRIYSFFETCVSNTATRVDGKLSITGKPVVLVDKASATHSRPWEMNDEFIIPIQRTHSDLVKFEKYSPDYEKVRDCFKEILNSIRSA